LIFRRSPSAKIFILLLRAGWKAELIHINMRGVFEIIVQCVARQRVTATCASGAHKAKQRDETEQRDAHYRPTFTDARGEPVRVGEHIAANCTAQMRCILDSQKNRFRVYGASRVRQVGLNPGRMVADRGYRRFRRHGKSRAYG
jgi:hypothetical protein